jgi:hypothetical protein
MFAAFLKTSPAETENNTIAECEHVLHERMVKMLRDELRLAWKTPILEQPSPTAVKKSTRYRAPFLLPN